MKIALIGLPQVGKKTVFSLLTGIAYDQLLARGGEYHVGAVKVADPRVDKLSAMYNPKKTKHAEIECTLAPAPPHEPKPREQWLNKLKDMDAFCHVVRAFEDPAVFHAKGSVDALRDIDEINLELTISDLALIELRLNRIAQDQKRKFEQERADEAALLEKLRPHLEGGKPLREYPWRETEEKRVRSLQFLTLKGLVTALNCGESNFPSPALIESARVKLGPSLDCEAQHAGLKVVTGSPSAPLSEVAQLCAKLEMEVAQIENPAERAEFLKALGIEEPAIHVLARLLYKALGYVSFFTVGEDEVRAWTIHHGATAVDAAHVIHSDLARGFIRAEVMKYNELVSAGDTGHQAEVRLKETGKLLVKGKDYVVEDGDIVHIRHSG
jgi:ribosome-binding ATPase